MVLMWQGISGRDSMPAAPGQQLRLIPAKTWLLRKLITMVIIHTTTMQRVNIAKKRCRQAALLPMPGVCTICTAMYGSGVAIGMVITLHQHKPTLKEYRRSRTVCSAAAAGPTMRCIAGRRAATEAIQTAAATQ